MRIKRRSEKFDKKNVYFRCFVSSLSPSIINYACPNFRMTCAMTLMFTFMNSQRLPQFHPTVMALVILVTYVNSLLFLFSSKIS